MRIAIVQRHPACRVDPRRMRALADFFLGQAVGPAAKPTWREVTIVLLAASDMIPVNREFLQHDRTTDVITFNYPALPGEAAGARGEILINLDLALTEGRRRSSPAEELALYLAHGCLHLAGQEDETPRARARMRRLEKKLLAARTAALRQGAIKPPGKKTRNAG